MLYCNSLTNLLGGGPGRKSGARTSSILKLFRRTSKKKHPVSSKKGVSCVMIGGGYVDGQVWAGAPEEVQDVRECEEAPARPQGLP